MELGRTLIRDISALTIVSQFVHTYNDGADKTEVSAWTEPSEREYRMQPDRLFKIFPTTLYGTKLLDTTGECTFNTNGFVNADASLDHIDRVSCKIALSNWGACRNVTFFPNDYDYMVLVTDGTSTHIYKITKGSGPKTILLPPDMTGSNSTSSPTMYIEVIFFDTDLALTEAFYAGASGAYYFVWDKPVTCWFDIYNSVDIGILGGVTAVADLAVSLAFSKLIDSVAQNAMVGQVANVLKVPLEVLTTAIATTVAMAYYYNWIEIEKFMSQGGILKLLNAMTNPLAVGSTLVSMGTAAIDNKWSNIISKASGSVSSLLVAQGMLAMLDDVALDISV